MSENELQKRLNGRFSLMFKERRVVLLTGSFGRRGIVREAELPWVFLKSDLDEEKEAGLFDKKAIDSVEKAVAYCSHLAFAKNKCVEDLFENAVVVSADTVVFNKKLLEKPTSEVEVFEMIGSLNDTPHQVVTAVSVSGAKLNKDAISNAKTGNDITFFNDSTFAATSHVLLSGVDKNLIKRMIETERPYACSGGYTIDGILAPHFKVLKGSIENIIGLPLKELLLGIS